MCRLLAGCLQPAPIEHLRDRARERGGMFQCQSQKHSQSKNDNFANSFLGRVNPASQMIPGQTRYTQTAIVINRSIPEGSIAHSSNPGGCHPPDNVPLSAVLLRQPYHAAAVRGIQLAQALQQGAPQITLTGKLAVHQGKGAESRRQGAGSQSPPLRIYYVKHQKRRSSGYAWKEGNRGPGM